MLLNEPRVDCVRVLFTISHTLIMNMIIIIPLFLQKPTLGSLCVTSCSWYQSQRPAVSPGCRVTIHFHPRPRVRDEQWNLLVCVCVWLQPSEHALITEEHAVDVRVRFHVWGEVGLLGCVSNEMGCVVCDHGFVTRSGCCVVVRAAPPQICLSPLVRASHGDARCSPSLLQRLLVSFPNEESQRVKVNWHRSTVPTGPHMFVSQIIISECRALN